MTCMTGDRGNNDATETEPDYQQFGHPVEPPATGAMNRPKAPASSSL